MKAYIYSILFVFCLTACQSPKDPALKPEPVAQSNPVVQENEFYYPVPSESRVPTREEWENSVLSQIEGIQVFSKDEFNELDKPGADVYAILFSNKGKPKRGIASTGDPCSRKRGAWARTWNPGPEAGRGCYLENPNQPGSGRYFDCDKLERRWFNGECFKFTHQGGRFKKKGKGHGCIKYNRDRMLTKCEVTGNSADYTRNLRGEGRYCIIKGKLMPCSRLYAAWDKGRCWYDDWGFRTCKKKSHMGINERANYECSPGLTKRQCRIESIEYNRRRIGFVPKPKPQRKVRRFFGAPVSPRKPVVPTGR